MNRAESAGNCGADPHAASRLPLTSAAVEMLEQRPLLAVIPMGEIGLGHRVEFATPHGLNSYTFSLDKPATVDITLSNGTVEQQSLLTDWPVDRPGGWVRMVNEPWTSRELARLHESRDRSSPFGEDSWRLTSATKLRLLHTMRKEGRPRKAEKGTGE